MRHKRTPREERDRQEFYLAHSHQISHEVHRELKELQLLKPELDFWEALVQAQAKVNAWVNGQWEAQRGQ